jgi:SAM-dependent methyltransferase
MNQFDDTPDKPLGSRSRVALSRTRGSSRAEGREAMNFVKRPENPQQVREMVREGYARVAREASSCCGGTLPHADDVGRKIGYTESQLGSVPDGANLGAGCGNPTAIDALHAGEVVVDLGSGAGMDAFLAARQVGPSGRVIGVDMTDEMLEKARANARKVGCTNVEFRKGTIEDLPLEDESVDVILSNCVINLSPEKPKVYREAYRVLRPGGRVMVSDIVLERPLPPEILQSVDAYLGCVGGASLRHEYLRTIEKAGFREVRVEREAGFGDMLSPDGAQVREAMERFGITFEQVKDYLSAVTDRHAVVESAIHR